MRAASSEAQNAHVRDAILFAAESRFCRYGYNKTTMAELATDVEMSAANLYRYFDSKLDIAAACCERSMQERLRRVRERVGSGKRTASQRLLSLVVANLEFTHELSSENPHIHELVQTITSTNQDLIHNENAAMQALIAEILTTGNERGEFDVKDVFECARSVHAAIALFQLPTCMGLFTLEQFKTMARGVVRVLVDGLRAGGSSAASEKRKTTHK